VSSVSGLKSRRGVSDNLNPTSYKARV
jgi:hypothetical protein